MIRGTRNLFGADARIFREISENLRRIAEGDGYKEFIPSALSEQEVFVNKAGPEILGQMYTFKDKKEREICLVPEITAVVQSIYKADWSKYLPRPVKLFYLTRCYRYERPQEGRYREFWQFGVESLGGQTSKEEMIDLLRRCLEACSIGEFTINDGVKRGLNYYVEDGFEAEIQSLGAQKQVAGGGRYDCGIGWAIGVDRLMLAKNK
jgi:histidyl-tRNA synthetase